MEEMKKYQLNCDVCDARNIKENVFDGYDKICINTDLLVINARGKEILNSYPVQLNVDSVVETEEDVAIRTQNGTMEIEPGEVGTCKVILVVNGKLDIAPESEEVLKHYLRIIVNGVVSYPKSLQQYLSCMTVNGVAEVYPDECIRLKETAVPDKYFSLRAKKMRDIMQRGVLCS